VCFTYSERWRDWPYETRQRICYPLVVDAVPIPAGVFLTDKDVTKLIYPFFCEEKGVFCYTYHSHALPNRKENEDRCVSNLPK
jgi:hypothetical protein